MTGRTTIAPSDARTVSGSAPPRWLPAVGVGGVVVAIVLLDVLSSSVWATVVVVALLSVAALPAVRGWARPHATLRIDTWDIAAVVGLYVAVVGLFRLAFVGFTQANVLGLFLAFAGGLVLGTAGPIAYTVWLRRRALATLGLGLHNLRATAALAVLFAALQFAITLWGYDLPAPVDWVPLLVMSLVVGLFEAVFFRGFVQGRFEDGVGPVGGVLGAAALYSLYHVGYGMGADELWFLFGLGIVYAVAYRLVENILVLWPLLTPLGAFFTNLRAGDIELPWASILGFLDVAAVIGVVLWLAWRHEHRMGAG